MLPRRLLPLLLALSAVAALTVTITPAAVAQDTATQLAQLERRRGDLDAKIAEQDRVIAEADQTIAQKQSELDRWNVQLELTADDYARTVDNRREPARTRVAIAIDAYVRGDPRVTSLLADIITMSTRTQDMTQRALYTAVVDDADNRLRIIDQQLRDIGARASSQQASSQALRDQLKAAQDKKGAATDTRQKLGAERSDIVRQIDDIRSRASRAVLTGTQTFEDRERPALVIKIDNVEAARPQAGINQADVVFEEQVEGSLTRLAAVFQSRGSDPVGPVRSARSSDVRLFGLLNKPLFASSGGNAGVRAELADSTLIDVGQSTYPDVYYRGPRRPPNNLYTRTSDLWRSAADRGAGSPPALFNFLNSSSPRPQTAIAATGVSINFGAAGIDYTWTGSGWARRQNGRAHVDDKGVQATPTNVIVQFTDYRASQADENSPEAITTGSGDVWVFTNGYLVRGRWSRKNDTSVTSYTDESGNPIAITPGTTWIELARPNTASLG